MKIAIIVSTFPALSETFILNQVTGLCDRGHRVSIFSRFKPVEPIAHPDVEQYSLLEKTRYFTQIPRSKWLCRFKAAVWIVRFFLLRPGLVIRTLRTLLARPEGFSYPILFTALAVLGTRPDVIHVHYGHNGNLLLPLRQIDPSVPFITMFHGHDLLLGLDGGKDYYTRLFARADLILANSEFTRQRLLEQGADPSRLAVHYVGIDVSKFPYRADRTNRESGNFCVLTVGRLCEQKGLEYSIRAVGLLRKNDPSLSIEYRIGGSGPLEEPLKKLADELGLSGQVYFLGPLDQTGVLRHLQEADVFLLTSIHEWLGMVLLEAQAVGVPVVSVEVGGIPEAVDPDRSAILVLPQNPQAAAQALGRCLQDPEKRRQMGQAGRRHIEKNFNIDHLNDKLEKIYMDLCRKAKKIRRKENVQSREL